MSSKARILSGDSSSPVWTSAHAFGIDSCIQYKTSDRVDQTCTDVILYGKLLDCEKFGEVS